MGAGKIPAIVVLLLSFSIFHGSVQAQYSGGTGSPEDPYLISTLADMNQIGQNYTDWDKCFKLTADINLSAYTGTQFGCIGTDNTHAFSGVFDGNGHTISGFTYTAENSYYIGVFGFISDAGRVENISLVDVNVIGLSCVGGLVGYNNGTISNCNSTGAVTGVDNSGYIGGLVGYSGGSISNCYSTGTVTGGNYSYYLGGLVGVSDGSISNCYSTSSVTGGDNSYCFGGLVGYSGGSISNCYSTGNVAGGDYSHYLGGLAGQSNGSISNCYSTGAVTGEDYSEYLGGLAGQSNGNISDCNSTGTVTGGDYSYYLGGLAGQSNGNISNCYSTGNVTGGDNSNSLGGLVGYNSNLFSDSNISNCYSTGMVSGTSNVGGLVGYRANGTISLCYFLTTSGPNDGNGTPLTDAQMKQQSNFVGWDFNDVWHICETTNYPKLIWQIVPGDFVCPDGVDFADYSFFAERWLNTDCASNNNCDGADMDTTGTVDIADLAIMCDYWLKGL